MALPTNPDDRPGVTYAQAQAILRKRGMERSIRTLQRWVHDGILSVKRITERSIILFRDEILALVAPDDPVQQRMLTVKCAREKVNRRR